MSEQLHSFGHSNSSLSQLSQSSQSSLLSSSVDSLLSAVENNINQTTQPHPPTETIYECNICYKNLTNDMVRTPCKHYYCSGCFFRWMRESQTCPNCRKLLVVDSHIETLIVERKVELISISEDVNSQYNIFKFLRRDIDKLDTDNANLLRKKRELEYLVSTKKMELEDLSREKRAIKRSIQSINNYRNDLERLNNDSRTEIEEKDGLY